MQLLGDEPLPGNIRELENAVRKALPLARGYAIGIAEIRQALKAFPARVDGGSSIAGHVAELLAAASRGTLENVRAHVLIPFSGFAYSCTGYVR